MLVVTLCSALAAQAQTPDTLGVAADTSAVDSVRGSVDLDVFLFSRYAWRGVQFGTGPTVQAQLSYTNGGFMAAAYVAKSTYGGSEGYPNTSNIMIGYQHKSLSLFVDDYFFYDEDNLDRYTDWSDSTLHYIEARLRYDQARYYCMVAHNVYAAEGANVAPYVEAGYMIPDNDLTFFAGYVFDRSDLNFATSAGVTNIGVTKKKDLRLSDKFSLPLTGTLMVNPSYKNVVDAPGVGRNFLTLVVGISF